MSQLAVILFLVRENYCPNLDDIRLGKLEVEGYKLNDVATYKCNTGAMFVDGGASLESKKRICEIMNDDDGAWSSTEPVCQSTDIMLISMHGFYCVCHRRRKSVLHSEIVIYRGISSMLY